MKILFTGGGTAGHILPFIAVAREIRKIYLMPYTDKSGQTKVRKDLKFYYMGPKDNFGRLLLAQDDIKIKHVLAGKIRRYWGLASIFQNLFDVLVKIPLGILQSFFRIFFIAPDLIFSKGGYGAIPATISGWILGVPVFLHESDIVPGASTLFLSKLAKEIFVSFPIKRMEKLPLNKMIMVGNPVRQDIFGGDFQEAKKCFKLTGKKPVVLVMGGSQGAQKINEMILEILPELLKEFEVIHQCGEKNYRQVVSEAKVMANQEMQEFYHPMAFLKEFELKEAYAACQLVTSRAGANTIFEIASLGKPSILIPLPESAQDHQLKNAYAYEKDGACLVIEEENLTPHYYFEKLKFITSRPQEMEKMKKAAIEFSTPQAARIIAEYLLGDKL